ncbi:8970_t:CDS:10 [Diversispora eburnea]|uniref:Calcium-channel protein CCH1 n=1 Tax=Diversispora eburnea TaxID=1213867 RepID=A0A9N8ZFZ8_9GLOM|nr:8970_t:CDS:10 [Diversispora eburnea]
MVSKRFKKTIISSTYNSQYQLNTNDDESLFIIIINNNKDEQEYMEMKSSPDLIADDYSISQKEPSMHSNSVHENYYYSSSDNPLSGKSLFVFGPNNPIRRSLYFILNNPWLETFILCLIITNIILLIVDSWTPPPDGVNPRRTTWGSSIIDYMLLSINNNQYVSRVIAQNLGFKSAFLRHSFNRLDLIAVTSYWIDLLLIFFGIQHFYLFKSLSTLRSLRLLAITSGGSTILQSLKKAAPLLINVASFIGFFFVLFSIIGVQAFKGSLGRRCVWINPNNGSNFTLEEQYCGGYKNDSITYPFDGSSLSYAKGYICPVGQICKEVGNPSNGLISFDNVGFSMILVFLIASTSNWSDLMYNIIDSEFMWSCIFFIIAIIVLNFWLLNLFVAVITSISTPILLEEEEGWSFQDDLFVMAYRTAYMSPEFASFLDHTELTFTIILAIEILLRICSYHPDYSRFLYSKKNTVDFFLVVITCVIQVPVVKNSPAYSWLTAFQIARVYRVVIAIPRLRNMLMRVLGSVAGIANLIFFILMVNLFAAIAGLQLLQGFIPNDGTNLITFADIFNSFIAFYQLFSGSDWTTVFRNVLEYYSKLGNTVTAIIAALFLMAYIAVSNSENFEIVEEEKHLKQIQAFKQKSVPSVDKDDVMYRWNFYRYFESKPKAISVDSIPSNLILPTQKNDEITLLERKSERPSLHYEETKGNVDTINEPITEQQHNETFIDDYQERQALKADFIAAHPDYDASLWLFSSRNRFRRFCQRLVPSSYGRRVQGLPPSQTLSFIFSAFIYVCIVANVILATIVVPSYQKQYFQENVIADGFLLTPNAVLLNVWNVLDLFVLTTLYANIIIGPTSRFGAPKIIRSFKSLRALRLINLNNKIKDTFYSILIAGAPRIFDALFLTLCLIIPFAIYGTNNFAGYLYSCNDDFDINNINDCVGEFETSPFNWNYLVPRIWANPYQYSFDSFKYSLLILFEGVSGEGWIDVMESAMQITGRDQSPKPNSSKWNALFFLVFNLIGSVFVITVFISVIMANFQKKSGAAYLTEEQKRWIDLKKLLKQIKPSKIPKDRPNNSFRAFCYDYACRKRGLLSNIMIGIYIMHILLLMTEFYKAPRWWELVRTIVFLLFIGIYILEITMKLSGLGWKVFKSNHWNLFDLVVIAGATITTVSNLAFTRTDLTFQSQTRTDLTIQSQTITDLIIQSQKIFLCLITFKLFQKRSLPSIFNLFAVWFIVFVIYSIIFMEIFGLTRYGPNGSDYVNFRYFNTAMLTLARMSTGEGWNLVMHDFTVKSPNCVQDENFLNNDCGSPAWAYFLFITWNVLSMYIFANMFIGLVGDNFSYCYQIAAEFSLVNPWGNSDINRTGYIKSEDFGKFFAKLEGAFEVRIYEEEFQIPNLIKNSLVLHSHPPDYNLSDCFFCKSKTNLLTVGNLDVRKLEQNLENISLSHVYRRKKIYDMVYHEALLSTEKDLLGNEKGISFTNMLLLLAYYKFASDDKCLEINEFVKRKLKLEKVKDSVHMDQVKSLLRTIYWQKKYKSLIEIKRAKERTTITSEKGFVPLIMVNNSPEAQSTLPTLKIDTLPTSSSPSLRINTSRIGHHISIQSLQSFQSNSPTTPTTQSPGSPNSPNSMFSEFRDSEYFNNSPRGSTGDFALSFGGGTSINFIDANSTDMDEMTAGQILNSLQSNHWHDALREISQDENRNDS